MSTLLATHPSIAEKAQAIGRMVTESLEMSVFKQAEQDLQQDAEASVLLNQLREGQGSEDELDRVFARLEGLDVMRRFTIAQESLSEVVSHVTKILAATVSDRIDLVTEQEEGGCGSCPGGCMGLSKTESCDGASACPA